VWFKIHGIGGHRFFSCMLAQQVWQYATNMIWQLFVRRGNLGLRKSFLTMQCLYDRSLNKSLKPFGTIWFFLRRNLSWIVWCVNVMIRFSMLVNGRWKRRTKWCGTPLLIVGDWSDNGFSMTWKKLWMLPMRMFLIKLTWYGVSKVLFVTCSNLSVT
jgi:hypothetical protein